MTTDAMDGLGSEDRDASVSGDAQRLLAGDDGLRDAAAKAGATAAADDQVDADGQVRAETPDQLRARLTPPPMSPQYLDGAAWLRFGDTEAEPASPVGIESSTPTSVEPRAVTPRAVSESAMRAVGAIDAAIASLQATRTQLLAGIGGVAVDDATAEQLDPGIGLRDVACELALQQRRSDRTVEAELNHAMLERDHWPATLRAWGEARIHRGHVRVITEIGSAIQCPEARAAFEAALIPHAEAVNPGRLRAVARKELEQHLAAPIAARHRAARDRRGVFVTDLHDGMSQVLAIVPTVLARGGHDRLTQLAKACGTEDPRSFDQRRADLLCELLLTGDPAGDALQGIRADVSVIIPPAVLLGAADPDVDSGDTDSADGDSTDGDSVDGDRTDEPAAADLCLPTRAGEVAVARLSSGIPIDPETARLLADRATAWTRLFTDPLTGHVTAADTYVPSARLKRLLRARDQRCRWSGCTAKAVRCDIDHTKPWSEGGKTEACNLAHLCRRHHTLKGAQLSRSRKWKVRQRSPGVLEFVSPMGEIYADEPPAVGPVFRDDASDSWGVSIELSAPRGDSPF